jgi:serine phosphatase RsbU (regulator of sigma subunit)
MKAQFDKIIKHIALLTLILSAVIMAYIVYELSITKQSVAKSLVEKSLERAHHELEHFFNPIRNQLKASTIQAQMKPLKEFTLTDYHKLFVPVIQNYHQISSLGVSTNQGFEHDITFDKSKEWTSREIDIKNTGFKEFWSVYSIDENKVFLDTAWTTTAQYDPRSRPWYEGAEKKLNTLYWTSPYLFNTNQKAGITLSSTWIDPFNDSLKVTLAYDLTLESISKFTEQIRPTKNGEVMVTTGDKFFVIGAPRTDDDEGEVQSLSFADSVSKEELLIVLNSEELNSPFQFESGGITWWGVLEEFNLNDEQSFLIVIALPENDFMAELKASQKLLGGGFLGILLLTFLIMRSHNKQVKNQRLLKEKNNEVTSQSKLISAKNNEILDSINYAKRIQNAILPTPKLVSSYLDNSFVLYLPKDIVAGDFYWMHSFTNEKNESIILFAAADCTGHGVPGAMISVMCHNALNRAVKEFGHIKPSEILDKTRDLVLEEFSKSEENVSDGMDISLCSLNIVTRKLLWSGANNPLWIFPINENKGDLLTITPDKQPVGKHVSEKPFTLHEIQLEKGDLIYIFTDGLQDQFGGESYKKFKPTRFRKLVHEIKHLPLNEQRQKISEAFISWKEDQEQVDDICIIGVRV